MPDGFLADLLLYLFIPFIRYDEYLPWEINIGMHGFVLDFQGLHPTASLPGSENKGINNNDLFLSDRTNLEYFTVVGIDLKVLEKINIGDGRFSWSLSWVY